MPFSLEITILIATGLFAGVLSGFFGIGGGIVIVPSLILFLSFHPALANSTSLAAMLLPVGILAVMNYHKKGLIDFRIAVFLLSGKFLGIGLGALTAVEMPEETLKAIYGVFLLIVSIKYIEPLKFFKKQDPCNPITEKHIDEVKFGKTIVFITGVFAGFLGGLFGLGGAIIIIPVLSGILKLNHKMIIGTTLAAFLLPTELPAVLIYHNAGFFELIPSLIIAFGLFAGAMLGSKYSVNMKAEILRIIYGFFLMIIAISFVASGG